MLEVSLYTPCLALKWKVAGSIGTALGDLEIYFSGCLNSQADAISDCQMNVAFGITTEVQLIVIIIFCYCPRYSIPTGEEIKQIVMKN